jgi:thioredoxin-related protein
MQTIVIIFLILFSIPLHSQNNADSVRWMPIEEAGAQFLEQQKPVLFFIFKDDCDSCDYFRETTFSNTEVSNYINILFYPVQINAETTDSLKFFDGKYYHNTGQYGTVHDLVFQLTADTDTFPTLVVFSRRAAGRVFKGYKDRDEIFRTLIYYAEDIDLHTTYEDWYRYHVKGYPAGQSQIVTRLNVDWRPIDEVQELMKTEPKKVILNFYNYNRIACTLMRTQTFNQKDIADYLNEHYYLVNVDVFTQEKINIKGVTYINENKDYKYHQLPIAALGGQMIFPAFLILDEEWNVLQKYQQYMIPEEFEKVIRYYGDNIFKSQKYNSYLKTFESFLNSQ